MGIDPTSLSLAWSPLGNHDASAKNAYAQGLRLAGFAAAPLRFGRVPDNISLTTDGQVRDKTVVSEITTLDIRSISAYDVTTKSAADAQKSARAGTTIDSTVRADGNVDVATADTSSQANNLGWVVVSTTVTYADGTTETSSAMLTSKLQSTGNGLARQRLEAIVGGSLSMDGILKKLGLTPPDDAAQASSGVPAKTAVEVHVNRDVDVSLTYLQSGDQRSVHGTQTGTADAVIASFRPKDITYDQTGLLSKTEESVRFAGTIDGGSLFSDSSSAWLAGSMSETTSTSTHIFGTTDITIARQSTATFDFNTSAASSFIASHQSTSTQMIAATDVANGHGGWNHEQITWNQSQADANEQRTDSNGVTSTSQSSASSAVSLTSAPIARAAAAFSSIVIAPALSLFA